MNQLTTKIACKGSDFNYELKITNYECPGNFNLESLSKW